MTQDPTPAPEYQPRPSGSGTGTVIAVVAAVVVLGVLCCGGVAVLGLFSFRATAVPATPAPVVVPAAVAVTPANETEQAVLELATQQVPADWTVPTSIAEGATEGTYVVTYDTPDKETQLLGPRQVIVDPVNKSVQVVPRE